jgi:hypothetical protein
VNRTPNEQPLAIAADDRKRQSKTTAFLVAPRLCFLFGHYEPRLKIAGLDSNFQPYKVGTRKGWKSALPAAVQCPALCGNAQGD